MVEQPVGIRERARNRVFRLRGVTAENGHRFRMVGLIARIIIGHRNALIRKRVQSGRIFLVDRIPFARFDDDEHYVLPRKFPRHDPVVTVVRFQLRTPLPFGEIFVQRLHVFRAVGFFFGFRHGRVDLDGIYDVFIVKTERAELFVCLCGNKLRIVQIGIVFINVQLVARRSRRKRIERDVIQIGRQAGSQTEHADEHDERLQAETLLRLHLFQDYLRA